MEKDFCPSDSDLELFIREQITDVALKTKIEQHLESCDLCQQKLEAWLDQDGEHSASFLEPTMIETDTVERLIEQIASQRPILTAVESMQAGNLLGGYYRIIEPIGYGTSGVVYRAEDTKLGRDVAVKVLRNDFAASDRARARLEREARAAASLRQPNIVAVHDVCIDPTGVSFLVMELVDGGTLRDKLRVEKVLESKAAARLAQQILLGLDAAHENGLVHRDLKSSNVLIEKNTNAIKLTDFGLVRDLASDSQLTRENAIAGTPAFMSPEQILNPREVDHRADIYSLGVVLYEMLSGELPFRGIDRMVLKQVIHDEPRSLQRQNDNISRDLETICLKALSKNPDARYESARLMHDDLGRWLEGRPIEARRVGLIGRAWNWSRRNSGIAALIALSVSLLSLLAIGSTIAAIMIQAASAEQQRLAKATERQRDQSLETLRRLIFDVNELLERDETDLDEVQTKLLTVAIEGLEEIDRTGEAAGLLDVSTVAAKNRLGDAYFRLNRLNEAQIQYEHAVATSGRISATTADDQLTIVEERLRAYEGLASMAMLNKDQSLVEQLVNQAEKEAARLSELLGAEIEPSYFFEASFELLPEEYADYKRELQETMADPPKLPGQIDDAAELADSLGMHYVEIEQLDSAEKVYLDLIQWLDQSPVENKKRRFIRAQKVAIHDAYYGLADVADQKNDQVELLKLLRTAIDALPKVGDDGEAHHSVLTRWHDSLARLFVAIEERESEPWMVSYFEYDHFLSDLDFQLFPTDQYARFKKLYSHARYVRVLAECGKLDEAKKIWPALVDQWNGFQPEDFDDEELAPLLLEFNRLKKSGFQLESN